MKISFSRAVGVLAMLAAALFLLTPDLADARLGKGGGFGSRGSKTFQAPPSTATAPRTAAPITNSAPRAAAPSRAAVPAANATRPGMFGSMSKGGFMAGLLGAGALGLLLGYDLSGGLGGLGAILGLMAQIALFAVLAMLLVSWWQRRKLAQQPAYARAQMQGGYEPRVSPASGMPSASAGPGAMGMGSAGGGFASAQPQEDVPTRPLNLAGDDFSAFERLLSDIHLAFAKEDQSALRQLCTEEMADYFTQDIAENVRNNQSVRIADVKLEQGDLSEAWKEPDAEYATVAMRFSLIDARLDRKSGRVVDGSLSQRTEITEIWTFVRQPGGRPQDWRLSAIQSQEDVDA